jgi:hypothetical protein
LEKKLTLLVHAKIEEEIRLLERLIEGIPPGLLDWTPGLPPESFPAPRTLGQLTGHLLQCLAGFLAVLHAVHPTELAGLLILKEKPVNHACDPAEALLRVRDYRHHIADGFARLSDADLGRMLPTVFVPDGVAVLTLMLGNFEHLVNHKHELFYYLKLRGVPLVSRDLYQFHDVGT